MTPFDCLPGERLILPDEPCLRYTGRIDHDDPRLPVFHQVMSSVRLRVTGGILRVLLHNVRHFWQNRLGVAVDGALHAVQLTEGDQAADLSAFLHGGVNDVTIFKQQDACHVFTLHGLAVAEDAVLLPLPERPARRIEVYGDSVSAGEVSEAAHWAGQPDGDHQGQYSNGWWSYAAIAARKLNAELHDVAQGGISLQNGTGYFNAPNYLGMLSCWDKSAYDPTYGPVKSWDFARYRPHVVIIAIGQNDAHPVNFMEEDEHGPLACRWREDYARLVRLIRAKYPKAEIILTTTILNHAHQWDDAIDTVCVELRREDAHIHHFLYAKNGCGTPGHIRAAEAEGMAEELCGFIESLGNDIWKDA